MFRGPLGSRFNKITDGTGSCRRTRGSMGTRFNETIRVSSKSCRSTRCQTAATCRRIENNRGSAGLFRITPLPRAVSSPKPQPTKTPANQITSQPNPYTAPPIYLGTAFWRYFSSYFLYKRLCRSLSSTCRP